MNVVIRDFASDDYRALAEIRNSIYFHFPRTVAELRFEDERREPRCLHRRWIAELPGIGPMATASYSQNAFVYHPRKFSINVMVKPGHQRRGIGARLYDIVMNGVEPLNPLSVRAFTREDKPGSIPFLLARGFVEQERNWESRLEVTAFDFAPYEGVDEKVRAQQVEIRTMADLAVDPERDRKLYELDVQAAEGEPSSEPFTPCGLDYFRSRVLNDPNLIADGYFVAVDNGEFVGVSNLFRTQGTADMIDTGFTGVIPSHRRRGIGLALKLRAVRWCKENGYRVIKTDNHSLNRAMLSINEQLGFVKQPAWITYVKRLRDGE